MKETVASIIDQTVAANPSLEERFRAFEAAYASVPEEKRSFYRFVFWMIATMRDTGIHISTSPSATVRTRKQIAYAARLQLRYFCSVLGFSPRNLAKTVEHLDKFLAWFRAQRSAKDKAYTVLHASGAKTSIEKIVRECVGKPRFNEWVVGYLLANGPLSLSWSDNSQNKALIGMAGTDMLRDFGLDFTEDEAKAIVSEDPNNAK